MELYNIFLLYMDKRMHTLYTHAQKVLDFTFVKLLMFGGLCISSLKVKHCGCMNLSTRSSMLSLRAFQFSFSTMLKEVL